jgi:hypothetical protein
LKKKNELLRALNDVGTMLNLNKLNIKKKKSIFKNVGDPPPTPSSKGTTFPYDPPKENLRFSFNLSLKEGGVIGEPLVPLRIHKGAWI